MVVPDVDLEDFRRQFDAFLHFDTVLNNIMHRFELIAIDFLIRENHSEQREGEAGNNSLCETSINNRLYNKGWQRPDARENACQLRPHPSGSPAIDSQGRDNSH